jgi:septal ring factor EnvC (AmiA/AmiB activator)
MEPKQLIIPVAFDPSAILERINTVMDRMDQLETRVKKRKDIIKNLEKELKRKDKRIKELEAKQVLRIPYYFNL